MGMVLEKLDPYVDNILFSVNGQKHTISVQKEKVVIEHYSFSLYKKDSLAEAVATGMEELHLQAALLHEMYGDRMRIAVPVTPFLPEDLVTKKNDNMLDIACGFMSAELQNAKYPLIKGHSELGVVLETIHPLDQQGYLELQNIISSYITRANAVFLDKNDEGIVYSFRPDLLKEFFDTKQVGGQRLHMPNPESISVLATGESPNTFTKEMYGLASQTDDICSWVRENIVVEPSGLTTADIFKERRGMASRLENVLHHLRGINTKISTDYLSLKPISLTK